jgi:molybdate transport system ATP-binding protein
VVGERARIRLGAPVALTAEVTTDAVASLGLVPGAPVWASVKAVDVAAEAD